MTNPSYKSYENPLMHYFCGPTRLTSYRVHATITLLFALPLATVQTDQAGMTPEPGHESDSGFAPTGQYVRSAVTAGVFFMPADPWQVTIDSEE